MTLIEFFEKTQARRLLVENLKTNMLVFQISETDQEEFLRMNLIMIRQAMQDEGVE